MCHILHGIIISSLCELSESTRLCFVPPPSTRTLRRPIRSWRMPPKYFLRSFVLTSSLRRFADILRPTAPPSWIDFVILSLRYQDVPHGITSSTTNQYQSDRISRIRYHQSAQFHLLVRRASLPSFQFRFWTSSSTTFLLFCTTNEACASLPPNIFMLRRGPPTTTPRQLPSIGLIVAYIRALCSLHLGTLFVRILSFFISSKKVGMVVVPRGVFAAIFGKQKKNRRASKPIDLFARSFQSPPFSVVDLY